MIKFILLFSLVIASCQFFPKNQQRQAANFQDAAFFENSVRRDTTQEELRSLIKIENKINKTTCSAFFIKNSQEKLFVGTQNHCAQYQLAKYCSDNTSNKNTNNLKMGLAFRPWIASDVVAYCKRIVAKNDYNDFMIIEIGFDSENFKALENHIRQSAKFLRLADFIPPEGTKLKMLGHPGDSERRGQPTATTHCYIQNQDHPIGEEYTSEEIALINKKSAPRNIRSEVNRSLFVKYAEKLGHNCTTYGGNSGGPILIEGSDIVIGLPSSYYRIERKMPSRTSISLETTHGLINSLRRTLQKEEITTTVLNPDTSI